MKNWLMNTSLAVLLALLPGAYLVHADNGSSGSSKNEVEFVGAIETLPQGGTIGNWRIGGRAVVASSGTEFRADKGPMTVGSTAEVKGVAQADGTVAASRIRIQDGPPVQPSPNPTPNPGPSPSPTPQPRVEGLTGIVEKSPSGALIGDWTIAGRIVKIKADTKVEQQFGILGVGALVEVKGTAGAANTIDATKVEVKAGATTAPAKPVVPVEVTGTVQFLPADIRNGDWLVSGNTVRVNASTALIASKGIPLVGSTVEVHGVMGDAGIIVASTIEVKASASSVDPMTLSTVLGVVRSRPTQSGEGEWRVNDQTIHVHSSTVLDSSSGSIGVGAVVQIRGWQDKDKSIHAETLTSQPEPPQDNPGAKLARFNGRVTEDFGVDQGRVDDRLVKLSGGTMASIDQSLLTAGVQVEVHGFLLDDGSFQATKVEVLPSMPSASRPSLADKQVGEVESADDSGRAGPWRVGGRAIRVTSSTRIQQARGPLEVGASVEVRGWLHPDGFLEATEIEVLSGKK